MNVALATFAVRYDFDWNRAERELRTALSLGPFTGTELNYANLCLVLGRRQEADEHYQRARDLDSLRSRAVLNYVQYLTVEGRFNEADEEIRKIAARSPTNERLQVRLNSLDVPRLSGTLLGYVDLRGYAAVVSDGHDYILLAQGRIGWDLDVDLGLADEPVRNADELRRHHF